MENVLAPLRHMSTKTAAEKIISKATSDEIEVILNKVADNRFMAIYKSYNPNEAVEFNNIIDLHGLKLRFASKILREKILLIYKKFKKSPAALPFLQLTVITGKGRHSKSANPAIKNYVFSHLLFPFSFKVLELCNRHSHLEMSLESNESLVIDCKVGEVNNGRIVIKFRKL